MERFVAMLERVDWEQVFLSFVSSSLRILVVLVVAWVLLRIAMLSLRRTERALIERGRREGEAPGETVKRTETLLRLIRQAILILVWTVTTLVVLRQIGVEVAPILASAGIAGVALGFGAQNLVKDVIAGFFIILENQVRIGDVAIVNGTGGLVERISFRTLVLRGLDGTVHIFPNGMITTLSNMTRDWSAYVVDMRVSYRDDADRVIELMKRVGGELKKDPEFGPQMIADIEVFGVDDFDESAMIVKARLRTHPIMQWNVGREYRRRLMKALADAGIAVPFPPRTLYFDDQPFAVRITEARQRDQGRGVPEETTAS
jgi:small conductance mechanosensitive channel